MKLKIIRALLDSTEKQDRRIAAILFPRPERIDGRAHVRHPVDYPAKLNGNAARAVNVSSGGCCLKARTYIEVGQAVRVDLLGPDPVSFRGVVRRVDGLVLGIEMLGQ